MATQIESTGGMAGNWVTCAIPGSSVGIKTADLSKVTRKLKQGLTYRALIQLQKKSGLSLDSIAAVVQIPRRTLARRKSQGRLTAQESERLFRLARVFEKALDLFEGDTAGARTWLSSPNRALANQSPLAITETEHGAREVESLIGRLEHGVFS